MYMTESNNVFDTLVKRTTVIYVVFEFTRIYIYKDDEWKV